MPPNPATVAAKRREINEIARLKAAQRIAANLVQAGPSVLDRAPDRPIDRVIEASVAESKRRAISDEQRAAINANQRHRRNPDEAGVQPVWQRLRRVSPEQVDAAAESIRQAAIDATAAKARRTRALAVVHEEPDREPVALCRWPGCDQLVKARLYACNPHWSRIPTFLQVLFWRSDAATANAAHRAIQAWIASRGGGYNGPAA